MTLEARETRRRYEREIAPRSLLRTYWQKRLHLWARRCIAPGLRLWLYRRMGIHIGDRVFIGLDTYLDCQFPELITIEDDVTVSFRVTVVVHDALVASEAVVARDVAPETVVAGISARPLRCIGARDEDRRA